MNIANDMFRGRDHQSALVLMSMPVGQDIEVYKNNNMDFLGKELPYKVKFILEPIKKMDIDLIKKSKDYLIPFFSNPNHEFTLKGMRQMSGWDVRLVNLFLARKLRGVSFFEVNTAGMSLSSVKLMFNFLISELSDSNYNVTYLVIEPDGKSKMNTPIYIDEDNLKEIIEKYYD